jgi:hypothetical protein
VKTLYLNMKRVCCANGICYVLHMTNYNRSCSMIQGILKITRCKFYLKESSPSYLRRAN